MKWGVTGVGVSLENCHNAPTLFNTFLFLKLRKTIPKVQFSAWQTNTGHERLRVGRGLRFAKKPTKRASPRFLVGVLVHSISSSFFPGEANEQRRFQGALYLF